MEAKILDGKKVAQEILRDVKQRAKGKSLKLAVVQVGQNKVSETYIAEKQKIGEEAGIKVELFQFPETIVQKELQQEIGRIGKNPSVTGLIVQLPLPKTMNREEVLNCIPLEKDVDVLSGQALKNFGDGKFAIVPPTVGAVQALFLAYGIEIQGKKVTLVGYGRLVGMPISLWLKQENTEFEIADKDTKDLVAVTKAADVVISGVGKANLITGDMIKQGAVVIDAGTSVEDGKTTGDVDFASVSQKASYITPVPGGVGPLTVACLLRNVVILSEEQ